METTLLDLLLKIPAAAWFSLLGVLIGAFLSLVGVKLSNNTSIERLQLQLQHEKEIRSSTLQRERLEELYVLLGSWLNLIFNNAFSQSMVMQKKLTFNQHLDQVIEGGRDNKYNFSRLEMIIEIYASNLNDSYQSVLKSREELNKIATDHKLEYEAGNVDGEKFIKPFVAAQVKIEGLIEKLQSEVANYAKKI
jgi:hypothetical protein